VRYKQTKGALKLHLVLDHDGHLPCYAVMTEGKTADVTEARKMRFEAGTLLVFDRGYSDYDWWLDLTRGGVNFVTRLKACPTWWHFCVSSYSSTATFCNGSTTRSMRRRT